MGARGLLNLGKSFWTIKIGKTWCNLKEVDRNFKLIENHRYKKLAASIALHKNSKENLCKHFYANFHESVTVLFLFGFSWNFHQNVELRNWEWYTLFLQVFTHFFNLERVVIRPQIRPRKIPVMWLETVLQMATSYMWAQQRLWEDSIQWKCISGLWVVSRRRKRNFLNIYSSFITSLSLKIW